MISSVKVVKRDIASNQIFIKPDIGARFSMENYERFVSYKSSDNEIVSVICVDVDKYSQPRRQFNEEEDHSRD